MKVQDEALSENWNTYSLGEIANIKMGQSPPSSSYNETGDGLLLVQGNADIKNRFTKPRFYTNKPTKVSKPNSLIMTVRAPVGLISKNQFNICIGRGVCSITSKRVNQEYLYQSLINYENSWHSIQQGSTFTAVNSKDVKNIKIPLPPLPEQQKIADILSTVDDKITVIDQQITATEELKKGLMQHLLTQGIGHTEFKDSPLGKIPKSWEVKPLIKASLLIKDGTHSTHKNVDKGIPLLSAKDVKDNRILIPNDCRRISTVEFNKIHKNFRLANGDILITLVGTIGRVALIENYSENYTFQRSVGYIRLKDDCNALFFKYFFQSEYFTKELNRVSNASAQAGVYLGELGKIKCIMLPLSEQKEIAEILSKVDAKLQTQKDKKQAYQQLKKGLMQQLLTGKIRVNNLIEA